MDREDIVAAVIAAAGGELIGRVRLQKAVYLLDQLGLGSEFGYEYHHYGPFSRDLENATADAKAVGLIEEKFGARESDRAAYSIYRLSEEAKVADAAYGKLGAQRTAELARQFAATNITVLELAATVDWLWRFEGRADWRDEIARRKNRKVEGGRLEMAVQLLDGLGLKPPAPETA